MDCGLLGVNCEGDNGGQYDAVSFRNCGKEPYSGVDKSKHPDFVDYTQQAGSGIFCMRVCVAGQQKDDPCNVKDDTLGCYVTMGVTFQPGFSFTNAAGQVTTFGKPSNGNNQFYIPIPNTGDTVVATTTATMTGSNSAPTTGSGSTESFALRNSPFLAMLLPIIL